MPRIRESLSTKGRAAFEGTTEIWYAAVGKVLMCDKEPRNSINGYAVAVKDNRMSTIHLLTKASYVCLLFIRTLALPWWQGSQ